MSKLISCFAFSVVLVLTSQSADGQRIRTTTNKPGPVAEQMSGRTPAFARPRKMPSTRTSSGFGRSAEGNQPENPPGGRSGVAPRTRAGSSVPGAGRTVRTRTSGGNHFVNLPSSRRPSASTATSSRRGAPATRRSSANSFRIDRIGGGEGPGPRPAVN